MLTQLFLLAVVAGAGPDSSALFEAPVRIEAGDKHMGAKRLYPSPVLFDVDGDGKTEMIIGDLIGNLTVSEREGDTWSAPEPLKGADGKPLKFHNW